MSEQYLGKGGVVKFCMWTSVHLKDHEGPVGHGAIPFSGCSRGQTVQISPVSLWCLCPEDGSFLVWPAL